MSNEEKKSEDSEEAKVETNDTKEEATKETKEAAENPESSEKATDQEIKEETVPKPAEEKKEPKVSGKLADIIKDIESLSVLELADLVKALEDRFGVSAAAPIAIAPGAAPAAGAGEAGPEEGQTTFNVILTDAGANKISVIKVIRELVPTLGLKEAKDLVDTAPKQVLEGVSKEVANQAKQKIETAGGKVEIK